jgi:hypothetical protein
MGSAGEAPEGHYEPNFFETRPGILFYLFQDDALWRQDVMSVAHHATADYVTPPVALAFEFPALDVEVGTMGLDIEQSLARGEDGPSRLMPADAVGISFWVRGDGSAGAGVVDLREDSRVRGSTYEFALADRKWHRVFVKWADFTPAAKPADATVLGFGLRAGSPRPASYIVDALRCEKTAASDPELAKLAEAANTREGLVQIPVRPAPATCAYNKDGLARARAKVRSGGNLKWLAYGDSVTVPVQMWNIPSDLHRTQIAYYARAARALENEYGCKIELAVDAVGGRQLNEGFKDLPVVLDKEKPDVLMLLSGDTLGNYKLLMPQAAEMTRARGIELLVVVPTYEQMPLRTSSFDWLLRFCVENGIACVDARSYLLGVPEEYWGDTTANPSHPNALGHMLIGQVVAEAFR